MRRITFLLLSLLLSLAGKAQEAKASPISLRLSGTAGYSAGEQGLRPYYGLSAGFGDNRFYAGLGMAHDAYRFRSIPLYAEGRFHFGKKGLGFLYGQLGYHFPNSSKRDRKEGDWYLVKDSDGGLYRSAGIGCRLTPRKKSGLMISAGFHQKDMKRVLSNPPCNWGGCITQQYTYRYQLGTMVTRLTWELAVK